MTTEGQIVMLILILGATVIGAVYYLNAVI